METLRKNVSLKLNDNDFYEGEVNSKNQPDGKGKLTCKGTRWYEKYVYVGEFKEGKKHGKGVLTYEEKRYQRKDPLCYEGDWKDDERNGYGIWKGYLDCYEGEWKAGRYHGRGVLTTSDGNIYEGNIFVEGKIKGRGKITYAQGGTYEGDFKEVFEDGVTHYKRSGYGVMTYPDGHVFDGKWVNDSPFDDIELMRTAEFTSDMIKNFGMKDAEWVNSHMDWDDQEGFWEAGFMVNGEMRGFTWRCDWSESGYTGDRGHYYSCGLGKAFSVQVYSDHIKESEDLYLLSDLLERDEKGRIVFCGVHKDGVRHGLGSEFTYHDDGKITELQGLWQNGKLTHKRSGGKLVPVE